MDDQQILERGGTEEDIAEYAKSNGADLTKEDVEEEDNCEECGGDGFVEIMGDGPNFEWDVVGTRPCSECSDVDISNPHQ